MSIPSAHQRSPDLSLSGSMVDIGRHADGDRGARTSTNALLSPAERRRPSAGGTGNRPRSKSASSSSRTRPSAVHARDDVAPVSDSETRPRSSRRAGDSSAATHATQVRPARHAERQAISHQRLPGGQVVYRAAAGDKHDALGVGSGKGRDHKARGELGESRSSPQTQRRPHRDDDHHRTGYGLPAGKPTELEEYLDSSGVYSLFAKLLDRVVEERPKDLVAFLHSALDEQNPHISFDSVPTPTGSPVTERKVTTATTNNSATPKRIGLKAGAAFKRAASTIEVANFMKSFGNSWETDAVVDKASEASLLLEEERLARKRRRTPPPSAVAVPEADDHDYNVADLRSKGSDKHRDNDEEEEEEEEQDYGQRTRHENMAELRDLGVESKDSESFEVAKRGTLCPRCLQQTAAQEEDKAFSHRRMSGHSISPWERRSASRLSENASPLPKFSEEVHLHNQQDDSSDDERHHRRRGHDDDDENDTAASDVDGPSRRWNPPESAGTREDNHASQASWQSALMSSGPVTAPVAVTSAPDDSGSESDDEILQRIANSSVNFEDPYDYSSSDEP